MSARSLIYLLPAVWFANRGFACDEIKCGKGFCIQRDDEVYRCVCMSGYEGENCDRRTFDRRFAPDEDGNVTCDPNLCENGGTCIETVMDGEAKMASGEAEMVSGCDVEGDCYTCVCPPGFTGAQCSKKTGNHMRMSVI